MFSSNCMSPADMAAVMGTNNRGNNDGFGWGGEWFLWLIVILAYSLCLMAAGVTDLAGAETEEVLILPQVKEHLLVQTLTQLYQRKELRAELPDLVLSFAMDLIV